ncbi:hypothetical protein [Flindersiella endophytica]
MSTYQQPHRGRGRITGVAAAAVALTLAVPLTACGTTSPSASAKTGPTETTTTSAEPTVSQTSDQTEDPSARKQGAEVKLDFDQLQRGTSDAIWWDAKQKTIFDGNEKIKEKSVPTLLGRVTLDDGGPGYLVFHDADAGTSRALDVVTAEDRQTIAEGSMDVGTDPSVPVVSADRTQFAWSQLKTGSEQKVTFIADANGKMISDVVPSKEYDVMGFTGDRVALMTPASDDRPDVALWDPASKQVTPIKEPNNLTATDPGTGLLAGYQIGTKPCAGVYDTRAGGEPKRLWRHCDLEVVSFSPDGKYAAAWQFEAPGAGPAWVVVVDARTGKQLLKVDAGLVDQVSWDRFRSEDQARLVLSAWDNGPDAEGKVTPDDKTALVACSLTAKCELLTDPVHYDPSADNPAPYVLGTL